MNILPLVLALILILSVLTIEKLEKFTHQMIVQKQYQNFLKNDERQVFNQRQRNLFGTNQKSVKQLSFRYFLNKDARKNDSAAKQYRLLAIELIKNVYGDALFFKNLKRNRPNFVEELLDAIQNAADNVPEESIKQVSDIMHLNLEDSDLQKALYLMLKGTVTREQLKNMQETKDVQEMYPNLKERAYVSLLNFINFDGSDTTKTPRIMIQRSPKEILKAIFKDDEVVDKILIKRNELNKGDNPSASMLAFENEFKDKIRSGIDDKLLDFSISSTDKSCYD